MKTNYGKNGFIILCIGIGLMACKKSYPPAPEGTISSLSVATMAPVKVTTSSALIMGSVINVTPGSIIESGIYLTELESDLVKDPSIISQTAGKKYTGMLEGESNLTVSLKNLKPDTRYGYTGFVRTVNGTAFSRTKILVTSYGTVSDVDGNLYQTVRIGKQIWMRENLKAVNYSDQTAIAGHYDLGTDNLYGKHYSWAAANRIDAEGKSGSSEGACPTGWHVPGDGEWQQLLNYIGVPSDQLNSLGLIGDVPAEYMKDDDTNSWDDELVSNGTGFSVLPADIVKKCDYTWSVNSAFWTSTPNIFYGFKGESEKILRGNHPDCSCGLSVRCVQDQLTN